ncbi:hypothetical protein [Sphingobacterium sp. UGAL515B_05]|uniref:hypothetical protein n=1 Tax=Sphingobacterium sp. UGAL515B_05 TaxID=2986767 RepID=UPI00295309C7|nr:hypothetical protein [Sphingobacterium sp. UGAL515B_05]WON92571.1 hypothetical protein OK025_15130 [Sphingobacterium sp. UGAL515B_05]
MKLTSDFTALHRCMPLFAAVVLSGFLIAGFAADYPINLIALVWALCFGYLLFFRNNMALLFKLEDLSYENGQFHVEGSSAWFTVTDIALIDDLRGKITKINLLDGRTYYVKLMHSDYRSLFDKDWDEVDFVQQTDLKLNMDKKKLILSNRFVPELTFSFIMCPLVFFNVGYPVNLCVAIFIVNQFIVIFLIKKSWMKFCAQDLIYNNTRFYRPSTGEEFVKTDIEDIKDYKNGMTRIILNNGDTFYVKFPNNLYRNLIE